MLAECWVITLLWRSPGLRSRLGKRLFEYLSSAEKRLGVLLAKKRFWGYRHFNTLRAVFSPNGRPRKVNDWYLHWKQRYFCEDSFTWTKYMDPLSLCTS